jgi:hypothetical protein
MNTNYHNDDHRFDDMDGLPFLLSRAFGIACLVAASIMFLLIVTGWDSQVFDSGEISYRPME